MVGCYAKRQMGLLALGCAGKCHAVENAAFVPGDRSRVALIWIGHGASLMSIAGMPDWGEGGGGLWVMGGWGAMLGPGRHVVIGVVIVKHSPLLSAVTESSFA